MLKVVSEVKYEHVFYIQLAWLSSLLALQVYIYLLRAY